MCGDGTPYHSDCRYLNQFEAKHNKLYSCRNPSTMIPFREGDIIACYMRQLLDVYAFHLMLALNHKEVMHISIINLFTTGVIKRELFKSKVAREDYKYCQIITDFETDVASKYYNATPSMTAIATALSYQDQIVHYNLITDNCEHWVTRWKYNKSFSIQDVDKFDKWLHDNKIIKLI